MTSARLPRIAERICLGAGIMTAAAVLHLLLLAGAAAVGRRRRAPQAAGAPALRFLILIPARDEEEGLPRTLRSVAALDYPTELQHLVVVADNCADRTAAVAATHGAQVLERRSPVRGKGAAIAWALARLGAEGREHDAIVFLDADCTASANMLTAIETRLRAGARAVQVANVVSNPNESRSSALRFAGFALINTVRPWGRDVLGLSAGILGTGFAVSHAVLERYGWHAFSLTEDTEFGLQLLEAGVRVRFAPEAAVSSPMPATLSASREQHARWESGKVAMARHWAPRLMLAGVRRRDAGLGFAALEGLVPSQSILAASTGVLTGAGIGLRSRAVTRLGLWCAGGQAAFVLSGLLLVRAPAAVYRSLLFAPVLIVWKLSLYIRLLGGRSPRGWERTER